MDSSGGVAKPQHAGPNPKFWFSKSRVGPENLRFNEFWVMLMQLIQGAHFKNFSLDAEWSYFSSGAGGGRWK